MSSVTRIFGILLLAGCIWMGVVTFGQAQTTVSTTNAPLVLTHTLAQGDHGDDVSSLQTFLKAREYYTYPEITGYFGPVTAKAVADFQQANGLEPVGVVGPLTRATIATGTRAPSTNSTATLVIARSLDIGAAGDDVSSLQSFLKSAGYYTYPEITGYFGPVTAKAVADFQQANGLEPVGVVGPLTRGVLAQMLQSSGNPQQSNTQPTQPIVPIIPRGGNSPGGGGVTAVASSASVASDTTGPTISSLSSGTPASSTTTITWTTSEAASSTVLYGSSISYGSASSTTSFVTSQSITLTGLSENTTYHYKVLSSDASGNLTSSSDQTFTTATSSSGWARGGAIIDSDSSNNRWFFNSTYYLAQNSFLTALSSSTVSGSVFSIGPVASGTTLISNGTFDADTNWTKGAHWSIAGGVGLHTSGAQDSLDQAVAVTRSRVYQLIWTVNRTSGTGSVFGNLTSGISVIGPTHVTGTFTDYFVSNTGNNNLRLTGQTGWGGTTGTEGTVDNVSFQEAVPFSGFDYNGMTVVVSGTASSTALQQSLWKVSTTTDARGSIGGSIEILRNTSDQVHFVVTTANATVADINLGSVADGSTFGVAVSFASSSFTASLNGGSAQSVSSGALPAVNAMTFDGANRVSVIVGTSSASALATYSSVGASDTTAPTISSLASTAGVATSTITWTTSEAASSTVLYGLTSSYGNASSTTSLVTSQSITLTGLSPSTTYHYKVLSSDASGNLVSSSDQTFTTNADVSAPSIFITSPFLDDVVSGTATFSADSSDNVAVAGVTFKVNGVSVAAEDTSAPYAVAWDTTATTSETKTIVAVARDTSGNLATSSSVSFSVNNNAPVSSSITATPSNTTATIAWSTDVVGTTQVAYGLTSSYSNYTTLDSSLVTSHSVSLTGLASSTTYHYAVVSANAQGVTATSSDATFTTSSTSWSLAGAILDSDYPNTRWFYTNTSYSDESSFLAAFASSSAPTGVYLLGPIASGTTMVANGTFAADTDWTKGSNWTIGSGVATHANSATADILSQAAAFVTRRVYQVLWTATQSTGSGGIFTSLAGGSAVNGTVHTAGTFTDYLTNNTTANNTLRFTTQTTGWGGTIDNVTVQEVVPITGYVFNGMTVVVSGTSSSSPTQQSLWKVSDATGSNSIELLRNTNDVFHTVVTAAGSVQTDTVLGTTTDGTAFSIAFTFQHIGSTYEFDASLNGNTAILDHTGVLPAVSIMQFDKSYRVSVLPVQTSSASLPSYSDIGTGIAWWGDSLAAGACGTGCGTTQRAGYLVSNMFTPARPWINEAVSGQNDAQIITRFDDASNVYKNLPTLIWMGYHDYNGKTANEIVADVDHLVTQLTSSPKKYLVLGIPNASDGSADIGSSAYTKIIDVDNALAAQYGSNYIDYRTYMMNRGLSIAGLATTTADTDDIALGRIPNTLLADGLHPNVYGQQVIARMVYDYFVSLGL